MFDFVKVSLYSFHQFDVISLDSEDFWLGYIYVKYLSSVNRILQLINSRLHFFSYFILMAYIYFPKYSKYSRNALVVSSVGREIYNSFV